ncbi:MAG: hypothetical protein EBS05_05900 [Proteobacteria bacterium]|nr:hypothetical protein [Pseudomonadota bacterium]
MTMVAAEPTVFVHEPSGIQFPQRIEQRLERSAIRKSAKQPKKVEVDYAYRDGSGVSVMVSVYPAPADAKGPQLLDGDARSDATAAFMKEFEHAKTLLAGDDAKAHFLDQMRFHAAIQQKGPLGMKATLVGQSTIKSILLCERNGYFVKFTTTAYPRDQQLKYGLTYHDVAAFIIWPASH